MKFNSLTFGAALVGAVAVGSVTAVPAKAVNIIGEASVVGVGIGIDESTPGKAVFTFPDNPYAAATSGILSSFTEVALGTLTFTETAAPGDYTVSVSETDSPWKIYSDEEGGNATFSFNPGGIIRRVVTGSETNWEQQTDFVGTYIINGMSYQGTVDFGSIDNGANTFEMVQKVEEIPTPALLPGLVGMGIAAIRKRRGESEEEVGAEA